MCQINEDDEGNQGNDRMRRAHGVMSKIYQDTFISYSFILILLERNTAMLFKTCLLLSTALPRVR